MRIKDFSNELEAQVDNDDGAEARGLVVATRPLKTFDTKTVFFTNPTYGREMAQNASFGGSVLLHNGIDAVAWTMSQPAGGADWVADSLDRPYAGTKSMYCNRAEVGDIMQILENTGPGTNLDLTPYTAITLWINVNNNWADNDSFSIYGYLSDGAGAQVGNKVYLEDYFDYSNDDIYQYISIPLLDMGLSTATIDAFRIECQAIQGTKPRYYIDNWYLQETGAPIDFEVIPDEGTWFHVKAFQTTFADVITADNADSTMLQLSYDKILDMAPVSGYIYKRYSEGNPDPIMQARITNLMDLLSYPYSEITNAISDGTNTMITITNVYPDGMDFVLKAEDLDKIVYTVDDAFDELLYFRICVQGFVERR